MFSFILHIKLFLLCLMMLSASSAFAVALNVTPSGQLIGAYDVDVGGLLYDVEFVDDSCVDLFSGCDSDTEFVFDTWGEATVASQALLDQVLLNSAAGWFNMDPELTFGCFFDHACLIFTPFSSSFSPSGVSASVAKNWEGGFAPNEVSIAVVQPSSDFLDAGGKVYAVWNRVSAVPEPSTVLLMSISLLGLLINRRSANKINI